MTAEKLRQLIDDNHADIFEGITSVSALINSISEGKNNRKIICVVYDTQKADKKQPQLRFIKARANELCFDVFEADAELIDSVTNGNTHGGLIALATRREFEQPKNTNIKKDGFYVLIEGIEDPYNFGYSVRSLYAAGADGLILPPRNWMELSGVVARSSAGTSELIDIYTDDPEKAVLLFKKMGYKVFCAGIRDSVSIYEADFSGPVLLIVGGEKRGISRKLIDLSDSTVRIDYGRRFNGSLPAACALSVIAFEVARSRKLNNS